MMLLVDDRIGSKDLCEKLRSQGVPAELNRLEYGDVAIVGNGPGGSTLLVGVEVKTVSELMTSLVSGRFTGYQLPGLSASYDVVYLIVEGRWRPEPRTGELLISERGQWQKPPGRKKTWYYRDLDHFLTTLENRQGVRVRKAETRSEVVQQVHDLYSWWTDSPYEGHRAHLSVYVVGDAGDIRVQALSTTQRQTQKVASTLPGVGYELSLSAALHFPSVRVMANAGEEEWQKIDGIGKTKAARIVKSLTTSTAST